MIVLHTWKNGVLTFRFRPESSDQISYKIFRNAYKAEGKVSLENRTCTVHLPLSWNPKQTHPDLLALAAAALILPFTKERIVMPSGVSSEFSSTFHRITGMEVKPIDAALKPRKAPAGSAPGLAFSGGVDSTVAAVLLPKDSHLFYLERITPPAYQQHKTLLNQEAAFYTCEMLAKHGQNVHRIKSDLQYMRKPIGLATFMADNVPAILLADFYKLDSLSNGHTLEEGYRVGYEGYAPASKIELVKTWKPILETVDLPLTLPTIGLSEVSTTRILLGSPYVAYAQACSRGGVGKPCMNCYKCFRKSMLEKTIKNEPMTNAYLDQLFKIKDAQAVIASSPIHFENVLSYITADYKGSHELMKLLKQKTRAGLLHVSWMEKWNPDAVAIIAPKYQKLIRQNILKHAEIMTAEDQKHMEKFHLDFAHGPAKQEALGTLMKKKFANL